MAHIPFPLSSAPGSTPQTSAGRLINCYAEPLGKVIEADKKTAPPPVVWRKCPGLRLFAASGQTGHRGSILVDNTFYAAWSGKASRFDSAGVETLLTGTLNGTEKVFWARNNKSTPDVVSVAPGTGGFIVTTAAVSSWGAAGAPNSVSFMDSYFLLTYGDGTIQATGQNDVTINALDKTKAQSKPGGLSRGLPFNGQYYALGPSFGEVYANTANPTGFPFTRSYVLQRGLLSPYAIAGQEDGFGSSLIWAADDNSIVQANGTPNPLKISPPDLDRLLAAVTNKTTLEAFVYIAQGHPKWVIKCPTFCWEFDLGSKKWNERASYLSPTWRAVASCYAFGKWIVGDAAIGRLLYVSDTAYDEYGSPLVFQIESGPVQNFPSRTRVPRADFNFVTGVGNALGSDPTDTDPDVGIAWSQNLGVTWGNEITRKLGRQATPVEVSVLRTGMTGSQGRRWRLKASANVPIEFLGGSQSMTPLRADPR